MTTCSRLLSPWRPFYLQPALPKAKYDAPDCKGPRSSGHTCFVLSRAKLSNVSSASGIPVARTCLKRDAGNTKDSLRNWVQLLGVNILLVLWDVSELTSVKTAPYLIALSTVFSIDLPIIGVYSSSNPSSSWSDKRRASTYAKLSAGGDA